MEEPGAATSIGIGSIVTLRHRPEGGEDPGYPAPDEQTWEITDAPADFAEGWLAADSPLGSQIMGSHAGDKLPVTIHGNNDQVEILDVLN